MLADTQPENASLAISPARPVLQNTATIRLKRPPRWSALQKGFFIGGTASFDRYSA